VQPWPRRLQLAEQLTSERLQTNAQVNAVIEGEIARRRT
jgi:hypothetical protein